MKKVLAKDLSDLIKVSVANPTPEKVNDMLDFCQENRILFCKFDSTYDFNGNFQTNFYFGDAELAIIFKLKFC